MAECRYYRVADHLFAVSADENLFARMTNYDPFIVPQHEIKDDAPVFRLNVMQGQWQPVQLVPVFTDTSEDDMPRIEVSRINGSDWFFAVAPRKDAPVACRLHALADFSQAWLYMSDADSLFAINNAAMLLFAFATAPLATLEMHAAVVVRNDLGYLFLGKSGTGKSTHAQLWLKAFPESWLLNDDNPVIRLLSRTAADGSTVQYVRVYGSPWSGKTPCYKNLSVPVGAVVKLSQAPHNEARRLRLPEAYAYMLSSASGLKIEPAMMDALYTTISGMLAVMPVFHLDCLPDTDAARLCAATVTPASAR